MEISGGLSNKLYLIDSGNNAKIKRVFGANTNLLVNRDVECIIMKKLSEYDLGPKIFSCDNYERLEEYLNDYKSLDVSDILSNDELLYKIFVNLKKLHNITVDKISKRPIIFGSNI